jgi:hypothetical protein
VTHIFQEGLKPPTSFAIFCRWIFGGTEALRETVLQEVMAALGSFFGSKTLDGVEVGKKQDRNLELFGGISHH